MSVAFVTGGSGFLGRNLIPYLVDRGWGVRALARSASASAAVEGSGATAVRGDLSAGSMVIEGMRGADVVFHAAAWAQDWGQYEDAFEANVRGTERILAAAVAAGVRRFVHVSTEAVLVDGRPLIGADESWPLPDAPLGLYPQTKNLAKRVVRDAKGIEVIVVRPRFIWGAGDTTLLPKLVEAAKSGALAWIGGGHYLTSTTHVRNACEGLLRAAERGVPGATYFITDGEPIAFREMVERMLATRGIAAPTKTVPHVLAHAGAIAADWAWTTFGLRGAPPISHAAFHLIGEQVTLSDARARRELGYRGEVTREVGLAEMKPG